MCGAAMEHILDVLSGLSTTPLAPVITAPPLQRERGGGGVGDGERVGGRRTRGSRWVGRAGIDVF